MKVGDQSGRPPRTCTRDGCRGRRRRGPAGPARPSRRPLERSCRRGPDRDDPPALGTGAIDGSAVASSGISASSGSIRWDSTHSPRSGRNVPGPTWSVSVVKLDPARARRASSSAVKCKPGGRARRRSRPGGRRPSGTARGLPAWAHRDARCTEAAGAGRGARAARAPATVPRPPPRARRHRRCATTVARAAPAATADARPHTTPPPGADQRLPALPVPGGGASGARPAARRARSRRGGEQESPGSRWPPGSRQVRAARAARRSARSSQAARARSTTRSREESRGSAGSWAISSGGRSYSNGETSMPDEV